VITLTRLQKGKRYHSKVFWCSNIASNDFEFRMSTNELGSQELVFFVAMMSAYKEDYAVTFVFISTSLQKKINFWIIKQRKIGHNTFTVSHHFFGSWIILINFFCLLFSFRVWIFVFYLAGFFSFEIENKTIVLHVKNKICCWK
jgi:hypothetical protein